MKCMKVGRGYTRNSRDHHPRGHGLLREDSDDLVKFEHLDCSNIGEVKMVKFLLVPLPLALGICVYFTGVPKLYEILGGSVVVFLLAAYLPFLTLHNGRISKLVWAATLNLVGLVIANYFISSLAEVQLKYNLFVKIYISGLFFMYWILSYVYPVFYFLPLDEKKGVAAKQIRGARKIVKFSVLSLFATLAYSFVVALFASGLGGYSDAEVIEILLGALVVGSVTVNVGMFGVSSEVLSQFAKSDLPVFEVNVVRHKQWIWIVLALLTLLAVDLERYRGNWMALGLTLILIVQTAGFLWKFFPLLRAKATLSTSPVVTIEMPAIKKPAAVLTGVCLFAIYVIIVYLVGIK